MCAMILFGFRNIFERGFGTVRRSSAVRARVLKLGAVALVAAIAASCLGLARDASAQDSTWVPLDASPPGTPAEVAVLPPSDGDSTLIRVNIHGFWTIEWTGPDQRVYQRIAVPGMASLNDLGKPDLPALRFQLAVPTTAQTVQLQAFRPLETRLLDVSLVAPQIVPDQDDRGNSEQFVLDQATYGLQGFWPASQGTASAAVRPILSRIPGTAGVLIPMQWNPATGQLRIFKRATWVYEHAGNDIDFAPMPIDRALLAEDLIENWDEVDDAFDIDTIKFHSNFLFICREVALETIQPLIDQKKARGFNTEVRFLDDIGNSCSAIRAAIQDWYNGPGIFWRSDMYCLLVGDNNAIPLCSSPALNTVSGYWGSTTRTDDLYASVDGDDLEEEIYLGRLSYDTVQNDLADLESQVDRILEYENGSGYLDADQVGLVAHQDASYQAAHELVWDYLPLFSDDPPYLIAIYGAYGLRNDDISNSVENGLGLLSYRGDATHYGGSTTPWDSWLEWNIWDDSYEESDVAALANAPRTPVVWSFAPWNTTLEDNQTIGETWMSQGEDGAVAFYGSTDNGVAMESDFLEWSMFFAVYAHDYTTISHAIEWSESDVLSGFGSDTAWMYLLLGDPDLKVHRRWLVDAYAMDAPPFLLNSPGEFAVRVRDISGDPVPGVVVAAWKPGAGSDEVLDNRYTQTDGWARVPVAPQTDGWLYYTVRDRSGFCVFDSVEVRDVSGVEGGAPVVERPLLSARPSVTSAMTRLHLRPAALVEGVIRIWDVSGRQVRTLTVPPSATDITWDGRDERGRRLPAGVYMVKHGLGPEALVTTVHIVP